MKTKYTTVAATIALCIVATVFLTILLIRRDAGRSGFPSQEMRALDDSSATGNDPIAPSSGNRQSPPISSQKVRAVQFDTAPSGGQKQINAFDTLLQPTSSTEEALLALEELADWDAEEAWPHLLRALRHEVAEVRAVAVETATELDGEQLTDLLQIAIVDPEPLVAYAALDAADNQPKKVQAEIHRSALRGGNADVGAAVIGHLDVQSDHAAVDLLIEGLDSIVVDTREDARETLDFIFDERFPSAAEAKAWWQANKNRYDRDLVEQDP